VTRARLLIPIGLCLLVTAAFSGALRGEFLAYDDDVYVTANPLVLGGLRFEAVLAAFSSFHAGNWHPLTWLSHMLDVSLFGVTPMGPHAVNVVLHAVNSVLAYLALAELTGTRWRAALAAALFAVHPLRVESVAWIAERKDVLSACFGLAALWAWARFARSGSTRSYWASVGLLAASLMSKPMLVTFPFLLLLLDRWPLGRLESLGGLWPRLREKWPFFALALASCLVTLAAGAPGLQPVSLELRLENAWVAYAEYLRRVVAPVELAALYPYPRFIPTRVLIWTSLPLLAFAALVLSQARKRPWLLIGCLWFAGMLVPALGLVQVGLQAFADRYTYLPFLGLALAVSWALGELASRARFGRELAVTLAALALGALVWQTRAQVPTWRDSVAMFTQMIDATRSNWFAHTELGMVYAQKGELGHARGEFRAALKIRDDLPRALANLGLIAEEPDEGVEYVRKALSLDPEIARGRVALGIALERAGRIGEAQVAYRDSLVDPRSGREARLRLARLLSVAADDKLRDGGQAVTLCNEACAESPCDSIPELDTCAMADMEAAKTGDAVAKIRRALELAYASGNKEAAAHLEERLTLYLRGRPLRMGETQR